MRALLQRELEIVARRPAFMVSTCAHVVILAGFVLAWSGTRGVPVLPHREFYQQARLVQAVTLAILLPWTAARSVADERGDDLVLLAALMAMRPSRLMLARACAVLVALGCVVATGLPVMVLAQRISVGPIFRVFRDEATMMTLTVLACAMALGWRHVCRDRLLGWMAAALSTIALAAALPLTLPSYAVAACAFAVIGGATLLWIAVRSDSSLRYLSERRT